MAPESLNEPEEGDSEPLDIPECVFYRENVFKGRWSRGWFHQLRWIHLKVDVKMKDDGSTQECFRLVGFRIVSILLLDDLILLIKKMKL